MLEAMDELGRSQYIAPTLSAFGLSRKIKAVRYNVLTLRLEEPQWSAASWLLNFPSPAGGADQQGIRHRWTSACWSVACHCSSTECMPLRPHGTHSLTEKTVLFGPILSKGFSLPGESVGHPLLLFSGPSWIAYFPEKKRMLFITHDPLKVIRE